MSTASVTSSGSASDRVSSAQLGVLLPAVLRNFRFDADTVP